MSRRLRLLVSISAEDASRVAATGARRDFLALAEGTGGELMYRDGGTKARGWRGRLLGPHLRQAWRAAADADDGDVLFADGEHVGLPLAFFLGLRRKGSVRVVMLGHLLSRRWKVAAMRIASRVHRNAAIVTHGVVQERTARRATGDRWGVALTPYQVDTDFWRATPLPVRERPLVAAVGSENRDYETLVAAARGEAFDVVIAAGSLWAREMATATDLPPNVTIHTDFLPHTALRELYGAASVVVVPLHNIPNQSGITVILEAMAMARPVVVTAAHGQRECVTGPLVQGSGDLLEFGQHRGPELFGFDETGIEPNGLFVRPGDAAGLRAAIERVLGDPSLAATLAENGRETVERYFTLEQFVARMGEQLTTGSDG